MALSPISGSNAADIIEEVENMSGGILPSLTYEFDRETGEFTGQMIDREAAFRQFIWKTLLTPRFRHLIYDNGHGSELEDTLGKDVTQEYLDTEIPRIVTEALIYDDRVESVDDFRIFKDPSDDRLILGVTVEHVEGFILEFEEVI